MPEHGEMGRDLAGIRRRLIGRGARNLRSEELLALVLGGRSGTGTEVSEPSRGLLAWAGGLQGLRERSAYELARFRGVGPTKAARLLAAFEIGRRSVLASPGFGRTIYGAAAAAAFLRPCLFGLQQEEFHVLILDTRHRLRGHRLVSRGSLQTSIVHPREVFRPALRLAAAALVVAHNHPSGDPEPSREDECVTERLREAGTLLGIRLLDHLILGTSSYYSFAEGKRSPFRGEAGIPTRSEPASIAVTTADCTTSSTVA